MGRSIDRPVVERLSQPELPADTLSDATIFAMRGLTELRATTAQQQAEILRLQASLAQAEAEAITYRKLHEEVRAERDKYMAFSTELTVQLSNVRNLVEECFEKAKLAIYQKPSLPPSVPSEADLMMKSEGNADPVPEFLRDPGIRASVT